MIPKNYSIWTERTQFYWSVKWTKIIAHTPCRVSYRKKKKTFQERHGLINLSESSSEENVRTLSSVYSLEYATRSVVGNIRTLEKKFFNCNKIRSVDNEACNDGGLAEITREDTADKIQEGKNVL